MKQYKVPTTSPNGWQTSSQRGESKWTTTSKVRHTISGVAQETVLAPFNYNVQASNEAIEIVIGEPLLECRNYADDAEPSSSEAKTRTP